jgi:hypothetical protein
MESIGLVRNNNMDLSDNRQKTRELVSMQRTWFALKMAPKKKQSRSMSDEHKAALAEGRSQGRAVRVYLEALAANKPKRGRKRTPDSIKKRLATIEAELPTADPLHRLQLTQEQYDLEAELSSVDGPKVDLGALERDFVAAAAGYAQRKGISYAAFRSVGVPPAVLTKAGIRRGA